MQRHIGPGDIASAYRTYRIIKQLQPDVVHGHGAKGGVYARLFGSLLRVSRSRVARLYSPHGGSLHYDEKTLTGQFFFMLERLMERAVALAESDVLELDDLPATVRGDYGTALGPALRRNDTLRAWTSRYVRLVLDRCQNNKREACSILDISYHTLQSYLRYPWQEELAASPSVETPAAEQPIV